MAKVNYQLFRNSTEHNQWIENNCLSCWKSSKYVEKTDTYTKFRCAIDKKIQMQVAKLDGSEMVSKKVIEAVKLRFCPYHEFKQKVKKHRKIEGQQELF